MRTLCWSGALALLAIAVPAAGQDDPEITVQSPLLLPSAGMMNDHMHEGGEAMIGLRFERYRFGGANQSGTDAIDDPAIVAAGYSVRTQSMIMDMVMLDLMYAPTANLTLMLMPHYMWHRMAMVGIDPMAGMDGEHAGHGGGHALPFGAVHRHGSEGFGDTLASASYRLARGSKLSAHATLGVWVPTGSVDKTNPDGSFVHYGMQPGGGTWDLEPSLTVGGHAGGVGWGAQASYRWKTDASNASGFAFGDKARATGWLSYLLDSDVGATARLEYVHEGQVQGHYNGPHRHASPPDRQENYGGDTVTAGLGLNWLLPLRTAQRPQLGAEVAVPIYQDLNGIQAPQDWRFSLALSQTF